tara:strand:- start:348 stop:617 length:270 start_codon:yes stop_codon:yes gene_type:complete
MPYPMKRKEQQMITEQDNIFDNLYEDIATKLDSIMDEVIADIAEEEGIQNSMMMRIVETWSLGVSIRLPLTTRTDKKAIELLNKGVKNG